MEPMQPMQPMEPLKFKDTPRWWPADLGEPSSAGGQNDVQYAYFKQAKRLLLRDGDQVTTYDTGHHSIQGVSQASDCTHAAFTSDQGLVNLSELKRL